MAMVLVVGVLAIILGIGMFQRRLIYYPMGQPGPPAAVGLPQARELVLTTEDGLQLDAWFVPASTQPAPGVLFLPGNAGNRSHRASLAAGLSRIGLSVLLLDYRGYGGNPGRPSEEGLARDARAGLSALREQPEVDPERILYFGESLGSGVAVGLAAETPPSALILRSPFSSLVSVAAGHYPYLPVGLLLRDRYPSIDRIRDIGCPLLIVAGDRDRIVPMSESQRLFDAALEPKRMEILGGMGHNDPSLAGGPPLLQIVRKFLRESKLLSPEEPPPSDKELEPMAK